MKVLHILNELKHSGAEVMLQQAFERFSQRGIESHYNQLYRIAQKLKSVKSPNNLKIRFQFGLRHAPAICRHSFTICDFLRVIFGTFRKQ